MEDVYSEIYRLYKEAKEKGFNVGEAIYRQTFFFVGLEKLICASYQNTIKAFQFCSKFSCSPFSSLQETPHKTVEQFLIIDQEISLYQKSLQKEK